MTNQNKVKPDIILKISGRIMNVLQIYLMHIYFGESR